MAKYLCKTNEYRTVDKVTYIILKDRYGKTKDEALIDTEDLKKIIPYHWYIGSHGYVVSHIGDSVLLLHQLIMRTKEEGNLNYKIDHIRQNPLDNRKSKLKRCSFNKNNWDTTLRSDNKSGYKGVDYVKRRRKWRARIKVYSREIALGHFNTFEEAVEARVKAEQNRATME